MTDEFATGNICVRLIDAQMSAIVSEMMCKKIIPREKSIIVCIVYFAVIILLSQIELPVDCLILPHSRRSPTR